MNNVSRRITAIYNREPVGKQWLPKIVYLTLPQRFGEMLAKGDHMMLRRLTMLLVPAFLASVGALAQNDPLTGTWKINLARSNYIAGSPPRSGTNKITAVPGGIRVVADLVAANGQVSHSVFTEKFDGKDYPYEASAGGKPAAFDTVSGIRIDENTYENTCKLKGQVVLTYRVVISPDGKTRTLTGKGKNVLGETVNEVIVYDKQ